MEARMKSAEEGVQIPPPGLEIYYERIRRALIDTMGEILFKDVGIEEALNKCQERLKKEIGL